MSERVISVKVKVIMETNKATWTFTCDPTDDVDAERLWQIIKNACDDVGGDGWERTP